jgi:hypothetical protein
MPKFRLKSGEIEAVQFDGNNWVEMTNFCGTRKDGDGHEMPVFTPIGTYLLTFFNPTATDSKAELWVEYAKKHFYVKVGDWIIQGQPLGIRDAGFHLMADRLFRQLYDQIEDADSVERL